ncbi:hypothetical protein L3X39_10635 [Sabulilitoribacter multivorans]|uniref:Uncharacterized protein n=1 Tax=Flaviramulus multivorans TaxID=1304750 RepID=A0ABS9IKG5_9FLAO|nr:hypothetical protein [Flaviramulus multivorans]MCF7561092.1 hypothetical protein [Flaviramulus multivorans]
MKITALLKTTCAVILFLTTTVVLAQDSIKIIESLPSNSEKLNVILPKAYWFNKYKIILENYGVAKIKEGISSTSTNNINGVTYAETKQKISVVLTDSENNTSHLQARTVQNGEFVVKEDILLNRVLNIGIEGEEIQSMIFYPKTLIGTITTNINNSENWNFNIKVFDLKVRNPRDYLFTEIGSLNNGVRTISIIRTNLDSNSNIDVKNDISKGALFYEFLENGISLGAVTSYDESSIWFKPGLDSITKLILCTAMLSIEF